MRRKSLREHGLLLELQAGHLLAGGGVVEQGQEQEAHPFIAMGQGLRSMGRGQKIDSLWRKGASVCPLEFWEAQT